MLTRVEEATTKQTEVTTDSFELESYDARASLNQTT